MRQVLFGFSVVAAAAFVGVGLKPVAAAPAANQPAFYTENVKPIIAAHCVQCHLGPNHKGGLSLETKASTLKGGRDGAVIVPGDPTKSLLLTLIRHEGPAEDPKPMPPKEKLSDADIATVATWIKAGAVMPDDPAQ